MIAISIIFPAGRYHATPWGNHVNEGVVEWPPSPWRFLRSLISVWKRRAPDIKDEEMRGIISSLLEPPIYSLPPASTGHSRHYMPWDKGWGEKRDQAKTKVIDSFVAVPKDHKLTMYWPETSLSDESRAVLGRLLSNLNYLGRSESWCKAFLEEDQTAESSYAGLKGSKMAIPSDVNDCLSDRTVRLLCANPDINMDDELDYDHPLLITTTRLRKEIRNLNPPGGIWKVYDVPCDYLDPQHSQDGGYISMGGCHIVRYVLDSPILPPVTDCLKISELARLAALSVYGGTDKSRSRILSGKNEDGTLVQEHRHTYYLLTDEDRDCKLDHLTLYSKSGFDREHQIALGKMNRLYGHSFSTDLVLLGMSVEKQGAAQSLFGPSESWSSFTPFILSRHPKLTRSGRWKMENIPQGIEIGIPDDLDRFPTEDHLLLHYGIASDKVMMQQDGPLSQFLLSLRNVGLPVPKSIEPLPSMKKGRCGYRWLEFKRFRTRGPKAPVSIPYGFRVSFNESVDGPVTVGFGSHLGMGLFISE